MKYIISILIFIFYNSLFSQTTLYSDDNGVTLKVGISKTNLDYECTNTGRKITIWRLDWIVENNSNHTIKSDHAQIATATVDMSISPSELVNCHSKDVNTNSNNIDNFPLIGFGGYANFHIKPNKKIKTSYYYYSISEKKPAIKSWNMHSYKFIKKKEKEKEKNDDDFWNGKKEKNNSNSNKGDDFWNGVDDNTKEKKDNDFWSGKGTVKEEDYFKYNTTPKESNQFIGEIESKTKTITIFCRDHGAEDGDRVEINNNENTINSNLYLTNYGNTITVNLDWGMNKIDFTALNQGTSGPNTAEFIVYDDTGKIISEKEWNIQTGFTATLLIVKL